MIVLKCDVCGESVAPAKDEIQAKRNLGLHKRSRHGVVGIRGNPIGSPPIKKKKQVFTPDQAARRKAYQKWYREKNKKNGRPVPALTPSSEAVLCKLDNCPVCGSRFYVVKGTA